MNCSQALSLRSVNAKLILSSSIQTKSSHYCLGKDSTLIPKGYFVSHYFFTFRGLWFLTTGSLIYIHNICAEEE